jgi:uncharacterized phage infection (PIP) family protein YhgE
VVAEEVRNLASRSAEAAKDTAKMIEESVKNAEGGVSLSKNVAKFLEDIDTSTGKVNDLVAEIAAASTEQSKGLDEVNSAVGQMNQITQQNAANSEESASASEELSSQAQELAAMTGTFRLSSHGHRLTGPKSEIPTAGHGIHDETNGNRREAVLPAGTGRENPGAGNPGRGNGQFQQRTTEPSQEPEATIPLDDLNMKDF